MKALILVALTSLGFAQQADLEPFAPVEIGGLVNMVYVPTAQPFLIDIFETGSSDDGLRDKPANQSTLAEAKAYCEKQGKRLPTRAEWMAAASNLGANKSYTLKGDKIQDLAGKLYAHLKSSASLDVRDFGQLGIDAIGTVGMTGNRPEWVIDGDGADAQNDVQCGGGYEVTDLSEVKLDRICSKRSQNVWRRRQQTATSRCVVDAISLKTPVTYSDAVKGTLADYIKTLPQAPVVAAGKVSRYAELKKICETSPDLETRSVNVSYFSVSETTYAFVQLRSTENRAVLGYLNCSALLSRTETKKNTPQHAASIELPERLFQEWQKNGQFAALFFASLDKFTQAYDQKNVSLDKLDLSALPPAARKFFDEMLAKSKVQEAIWVLGDYKLWPQRDALTKMLMDTMANDEVVSFKPFQQNGNVSKTALIKLKSGLTILYKPCEDRTKGICERDVAASRIDFILRTNFVPTVILRKTKDVKLGSFHYFVEDAQVAADAGQGRTPKLTYFDNIIKNSDRHAYNFLLLPWIEGQKKLVAIDHNLIFDCIPFCSGHPPNKIETFPKSIYERVALLTNQQTLSDLFADLQPADALLLKGFVDAVLARSQELIRILGDKAFSIEEP